MHDLVRDAIAEKGLLGGSGPLLLGVSGGIDSMALLRCLCELGYPVVCAHFNHRLRPGADRDVDVVRAAAADLGAGFLAGEGDVRSYRAEHGLSLEEAARKLRYRFLFDRAAAAGARAVVTAHTADDRVETVVLNLLRGAGLRGLRGMVPATTLPEFDPRIPLVRPLLGVWRRQVVAYQAEAGYPFVEDESNRDPSFFRNRIRHEIIPFLEEFNPSLRRTLLRTAQALETDDELLGAIAAQAWDASLQSRSADWIEWDAGHLSVQPDAVLVRLLRMGAAALAAGADDLDYDGLRRAIGVVRTGGAAGICELPGGFTLRKEYDRIWLTVRSTALPVGAWPQVGPGAVRIDALPSVTGLGGDWTLSIEFGGPGGQGSEAGYTARLDAEALHFPLEVRGRWRGARFAPEGMAGHSKRLSDAMIDWKIPRRLRAGWPLLVSGEKIVWVPGYRVGEGFAAGPETVRPVVVRLYRG